MTCYEIVRPEFTHREGTSEVLGQSSSSSRFLRLRLIGGDEEEDSLVHAFGRSFGEAGFGLVVAVVVARGDETVVA